MKATLRLVLLLSITGACRGRRQFRKKPVTTIGNSATIKPIIKQVNLEEGVPRDLPSTPSSQEAEPYTDDGYIWPKNLYDEVRDMAAASFLVYDFAYILDVGRKTGIDGIEFDSDGHIISTDSTNDSRTLPKSFTPFEVQQLVTDNLEMLREHYDEFDDKTMLDRNLEELKSRAVSLNFERPITLEEFDDKYQQSEMVYAITKDDVKKRITLVFRGTENNLAGLNNWAANILVLQKKVDLPQTEVLQRELPRVKSIRLHTGYHNYIFGSTQAKDDDEGKLKFDQIVEDIKRLLKDNEGYKLYVTGHSLGGALAGMASFFLACEEDIPKPVSCITFASPRFGDYNYLQAVQVLERKKLLRYCRIMNAKDTVAVVPSSVFPITDYHHGGFQVKLRADQPKTTFPRLDSLINRVRRTLDNSHLSAFNLAYDHNNYREQIEEHSEWFKAQSLNKMYGDSELTGFGL